MGQEGGENWTAAADLLTDAPQVRQAAGTDADASVMKMADGGFRPTYNTQFATDCEEIGRAHV